LLTEPGPADASPLFLAHAINGSPLPLVHLARELSPVPVYGAAAPGLQAAGLPPATVEELAAHYARQLLLIQPRGPYHVGGYCSGATIALEMACQLWRIGQPLGPLVLIDPSLEPYDLDPTPAPASRSRRRGELFSRAAAIVGPLSAMESSSPETEARRAAVSGLLRQLGLPEELSHDPLGLRTLMVMSSNYHAWISYRPPSYNGPVTMFLARHPSDRLSAKQRAWSRIARGAVSVHVLDANHMTILSRQSTRQIATLLRETRSAPPDP
jgi:thioesterase domain-containing protein